MKFLKVVKNHVQATGISKAGVTPAPFIVGNAQL
jgi:hypothetical protein